MKDKSKMVEALNIKTIPKFKKTIVQLKLDYIWSIVLYRIVFDGMSYEEAGKPFKLTKHAIYERLKIAQKKLNK